MIFVTVGTTDFDDLIIKVDEIAPFLSEPVVMQIGDGQYIPRNGEHFRFAPSLDPYYDRAEIVISHGGLGTVTEALEKGKKLIGIENTSLLGSHQADLLSTLANEGYLIWCQDLDKLSDVVETAKQFEFKRYVAPDCQIHTVIGDYLRKADKPLTTSYRKADGRDRAKDDSAENCAQPSRSARHMLFRKAIRWTVASTMYYSGATFLFNPRRRARILVYHSISESPLNPFSVPPRDFEEQMRFLAQEYNVIPLEELVGCIRDEKKALPPHAVAITLDDGFQDNYTYAYPILKKYGLPATIFLIVERLESQHVSSPPSEQGGAELYLSWDQVLEMSENGISFGSHTLTHPWLTQVTLQEASREIAESKARLEQRLGKPVQLFAYPGGRACDFDEDIRTAVARSGYFGACVGLNGTNGCNTDPYLLKRTKIEVNDGMYVFKKAMKGTLDVFILLDQARRFLVKGTDPGYPSSSSE